MIIRNKVFPFGRYAAINICGLIFSKVHPTQRLLRHEHIHTLQQIEMLFVFFYLWYGAEWFVNLLRYRNLHRAYRNISFEREAYACEHILDYPRHRRFWAWIRYLKSS